MSTIDENALDFAKEHIEKYYDSDFFPKALEFDAIWHNWGDVKDHLLSRNVGNIQVTSPRTMLARKPKGQYRVVQQLSPLDSLVYTALAYKIAPDIENARVPEAEHVACSYRFDIRDGGFFARGNGHENYVQKMEELGRQHQFVLRTDITDFYNQIYLHRLKGTISQVNTRFNRISEDIETFLMNLNVTSSQGVPVGPAASIVMAESIMSDIDSFLITRNLPHTRYVDDRSGPGCLNSEARVYKWIAAS